MDAGGSGASKEKFLQRRKRGNQKIGLKRNSNTTKMTARTSTGAPRHHSQEGNWFFVKARQGTGCHLVLPGLEMAPSGPSLPLLHPLSAVGGLGEPPKTQARPCPRDAEGRPSHGHSRTELVVTSHKCHRPDTKHDKGGGEQSMTSARMEITSAAARSCSLPGHRIALPGRAQGRSSS